jgi:hypothetical protein
MWTVWNKQTEINGFSADFILGRNKHLSDEETIFIKTAGDRVTQIEGKSILAEHYGIEPTLPDEEFIAAYEAITNPPADPDEITDSEALAILRGEAEA